MQNQSFSPLILSSSNSHVKKKTLLSSSSLFSFFYFCRLHFYFYFFPCNGVLIWSVELKKQISCSLQLSNKTENHVAFKVNFRFNFLFMIFLYKFWLIYLFFVRLKRRIRKSIVFVQIQELFCLDPLVMSLVITIYIYILNLCDIICY